MWPFKSKPIIDADAMDWHLENFAWLVKTFADGDEFAKARLVLPAQGFFTTDGEQGHALAERLFEQVKVYCGMQRAPIKLMTDEGAAPDVGAFGGMAVQGVQHTSGLFSVAPEEEVAVIRYAPRLLADPLSLIATFAHELGHFLLATQTKGNKPPCEEDEHEFLTDLAAIYMGFGVFMANNAFHFEQSHGGWAMSRQGYLPETDLVFGVALFIRVKNLDPAPASKYLKPHLAKLLLRALKLLDSHPERIAAIRASDPSLAAACRNA